MELNCLLWCHKTRAHTTEFGSYLLQSCSSILLHDNTYTNTLSALMYLHYMKEAFSTAQYLALKFSKFDTWTISFPIYTLTFRNFPMFHVDIFCKITFLPIVLYQLIDSAEYSITVEGKSLHSIRSPINCGSFIIILFRVVANMCSIVVVFASMFFFVFCYCSTSCWLSTLINNNWIELN